MDKFCYFEQLFFGSDLWRLWRAEKHAYGLMSFVRAKKVVNLVF